MRIAITGASGHLGRAAADQLLERVDAADVVLITRSPERLAEYAERGADVRRGDFDDPATLADAFAGVDRLLLISADRIGERVAGHKAAIDAAAAAGVRAAAYTSILNPSDSNPIVVAAEHRATEEHLRASGLAWTFLRNSIYAEMLLAPAAAAVATGAHVANEGEGRTSYVARLDCAAAAAAVIATDGHAGKTYDITGPEALDPRELAALFAELGGKPVEAVLVDDAAYAAGLVEHAGLPTPAAKAYATFGQGGRLGYTAVVSTTVQELTGATPRTVRDVLAEELAEAPLV